MRPIILTTLFLLAAVAVAQQNAPPKAVPLRRLVTRGEMLGPLSEIYLDLEASAGMPGDMVALRICSPDPLPVAIILAVVSPVGIGTDLASGVNNRIAYSEDRVFILRSPDCPVTHPPYVPVEFWGVPRGAALPPAIEAVKLCQIKVSGTTWFDTTGRKRNPRPYRTSLNELLVKLREDSEGIAVIHGRYDTRPSPSLKRSLKEAESFFRESGVPGNRFFVRLKPTVLYGREPKYPDLYVVHIATNCNAE